MPRLHLYENQGCTLIYLNVRWPRLQPALFAWIVDTLLDAYGCNDKKALLENLAGLLDE